ncbi:hypothetical protein GCM10010394_17070 [Streptomyces crystallinus]|uniref:Uncharacterized protein n=1 Tax=Streptomyces crystallinus TaxID=68191 RepID=A0ABP3QEG2_9ACTN
MPAWTRLWKISCGERGVLDTAGSLDRPDGQESHLTTGVPGTQGVSPTGSRATCTESQEVTAAPADGARARGGGAPAFDCGRAPADEQA